MTLYFQVTKLLIYIYLLLHYVPRACSHNGVLITAYLQRSYGEVAVLAVARNTQRPSVRGGGGGVGWGS